MSCAGDSSEVQINNDHKKAEPKGAEPVSDVQQLMDDLHYWREFIWKMHELLVWKQPWYAAVITGLITLVFLLFWYFDPSVITVFVMLALLATVLDFAVPECGALVIGAWNDAAAEEFQHACAELLDIKTFVVDSWMYLRQLKAQHPLLHCIGVAAALMGVGYLSLYFSSIVLLYLSVMAICLAPGFKRSDIINSLLVRLRSATHTYKTQ